MNKNETYFCNDYNMGYFIMQIPPNTIYNKELSSIKVDILFGRYTGEWKVSRRKLICNHNPLLCIETQKELRTAAAFESISKDNIVILKTFTSLDENFPIAFFVLSGNKKVVLPSKLVEFSIWK